MEQEEKFKRKVGERGQVTIPIELRERFGLKSGEEVIFTVSEEGNIRLQKPEREDELAAAYQRTAERDKEINREWEHVSVEATSEVKASDLNQESTSTANADYNDDPLQGLEDRAPEWEVVYPEATGEVKAADSKKYISRFCSELGLSGDAQEKAKEIIEVTAEKGLLSGKSPKGYAGAAAYAASLLCNEKKTQQEIADVAQVTEMTIRNCYQEQIKAMGIHS